MVSGGTHLSNEELGPLECCHTQRGKLYSGKLIQTFDAHIFAFVFLARHPSLSQLFNAS